MAVSMIQNYGATESETGGGVVEGGKDHELSHVAVTQRMECTFGTKYVLHTRKFLSPDFLLSSR